MLYLITAFLAAIRVFFRSRVNTSLEILALRQQVAVFKQKRPEHPNEIYWILGRLKIGFSVSQAKTALTGWSQQMTL